MPPFRRTAGQRRVVNDAQSTPDAEELEVVFRREFLHERQHFFHRQFEWLHLRKLRANVHLNAAQPQVLQLARARIHAFHLLERDAELVRVSAGRDFCVCARVDVRVHAHRHRRNLLHARRDSIDALQLRFALDVERVNPFAQRELDLGLRLANAGKNALLRVPACRDHAAQFPFAHDVESTAEIGERPHHGEVRVRLHRIANHVVE